MDQAVCSQPPLPRMGCGSLLSAPHAPGCSSLPTRPGPHHCSLHNGPHWSTPLVHINSFTMSQRRAFLHHPIHSDPSLTSLPLGTDILGLYVVSSTQVTVWRGADSRVAAMTLILVLTFMWDSLLGSVGTPVTCFKPTDNSEGDGCV